MFERFTRQARQVVIQAQEETRNLGHPAVGSEHLLLAALSRRDDPAAAALSRLGVTAGSCRTEVERLTDRGGSGLGPDDAESLRSLGIDPDEIRSRAEAAFGPGALDPKPEKPEPARGLRRLVPVRRARRGGGSRSGGHLAFTPRAKKALERSLREALSLEDRHIGTEHVLLGLLNPEDKVTTTVLRRLGTEPDTARATVLSGLGRTA
ncbi:peptidase [Streptomyces sp. S07_1.15]|uniref:Clp protease N-terminal domain-containing protein n=1 Tax=Streptomyces sp. S07_1.15 TaxID=2873925 RepID=UPI001D136965|nr:Clp protease N-terminal domain-containing protein [Streptomyces sp. S07_1.15]MCC3651004.1 peptidase [Streptomyces sp. S07_1.15]